MLTAAALVPSTPLVMPGLDGTAAPAHEVRSAAIAAVAELASSGCELLAVVADATMQVRSLRAFGGTGPDNSELPGVHRAAPAPLAITVGEFLLDAVGSHTERLHVALDGSADAATARVEDLVGGVAAVGLLVVGSASACSSPRAPGSLHPGAESFNAAVIRAVRDVDTSVLSDLSAADFATQMSDLYLPLSALLVAARQASLHARILYDEAPFGVHYACAVLRA